MLVPFVVRWAKSYLVAKGSRQTFRCEAEGANETNKKETIEMQFLFSQEYRLRHLRSYSKLFGSVHNAGPIVLANHRQRRPGEKMTSLDPSHFPDLGRKDHISRGNAVVRPQGGPNSAHLHIPVIPDLRFEYSYLKSIAPYVKTRRIAAPGADEKHSTEEIDIDVEENGGAEVVAIDWRKVAWITTRDQVISPLIQGAVWCVNLSYLTAC